MVQRGTNHVPAKRNNKPDSVFRPRIATLFEREDNMRLGNHIMGAILAVALTFTGCAGEDGVGTADSEVAAAVGSSTASESARPEDNPSILLPAHAYELSEVHEVDGRQGVAAEGDFVWVSGSTTLSRYDADWNLLATNEEPFSRGYEHEVNHIGDIDTYGGKLYCGVELFVDGEASNIQVAVYDGQTLELERTFDFDSSSGQDECSGICVDANSGSVWMCSWTATGRYLYRYDLTSGAYLGRVQLHASPQWIQGVAYHEGSIYLTADDGDADLGEPDHVYRATLDGGGTHATVALERTLDDVALPGEVEGLTFTDDGQMLVLHNRGARIVLGMPVGFYDGYDREIHEVYAYRMEQV